MSHEEKTKSEAGTGHPGSDRSRVVKILMSDAQATARLHKQKAARAPETPLMIRPNQAWKMLCVRTGSAISMRTFYSWIGRMAVPSVRLGGRIFIPVQFMEELIENCLNGQPLI